MSNRSTSVVAKGRIKRVGSAAPKAPIQCEYHDLKPKYRTKQASESLSGMPGGYLKDGGRSKISQSVKFSGSALTTHKAAASRYGAIPRPMLKAKLKKMKRPSTGAASLSIQKGAGLSTMSDMYEDRLYD